MNLISTLAKVGKTPTDVSKIYIGKDHCCRCGCGGKYHYRGTSGFTHAMNRLQSERFLPLTPGTHMRTADGRILECEGIDFNSVYVNIPYDGPNDRCYCLYFD